MTAEIVTGAAFIISCIILYNPLSRVIAKILGAHSYNIRSSIETSLEDKEKYYELLKKVIARYDNLDKEIEAIVDAAKEKARLMEKNMQAETKAILDEKLKTITDNLSVYTDQALLQLRKECVELATLVVAEFIEKDFSSNSDQEKILKLAFNEVKKKLN